MSARHARGVRWALAAAVALGPAAPARALEPAPAIDGDPTPAEEDMSIESGATEAAPAPTEPTPAKQAEPSAAEVPEPAPPASAEANPLPAGVVARASLEVDTSQAGVQSPVLLQRVEELGDIELRRAEILPSRNPADPVIKLSLRLLDDGGYAITSYLQLDGARVAHSDREVLCSLCTEGETVERARIDVERLIPFIRDHAAAQARAAEEARAAPPPAEPVDTRPRLATLSKVGVGLLVPGVVGVAVGLPLALRQPTPRPEMPLETVDTRVAGYVALAVGGALVITGVSLIIVGQRRQRRSTVALTPTLGGVQLVGRF